ncbi:alpha beta-hydrolase [Cyathus striatus]|nr:alpha beta-hydrolase [Cyathus striatus]
MITLVGLNPIIRLKRWYKRIPCSVQNSIAPLHTHQYQHAKSLLAKDADLSLALKEFRPLLAGLPEFNVGVHPDHPDGVRPLAGAVFKAPDMPTPDVATVEQTFVDDVRVIVVKPANTTGKTPAVLWIQGGGFIIGTPESRMPINIHFAKKGIATVLLEYSLAPEKPYPHAHNDVYKVWQWLISPAGLEFVNADPTRLVFAGTSAGATLAEVSVIRHHLENPTAIQPRLVLLDNPITDNRPELYPSMHPEHPQSPSPFWTATNNTDGLKWLGAASNWEGFPAYASDEQLKGLPLHFVGIAELDCLRDEAIVFTQRLLNVGVRVEMRLYVGTTHTYSAMFETPASHRTRDDYANACFFAFEEF